MTEMRPDPDSDLAGAGSEYGDDTGFAADATRTGDPAANPEVTSADDTAGLTAEDEAEARPDDPTAGPGAGAD